uniref:Reverse transcriptase Ty1/copia-type domain-containing protein n=1 Tax=Triticum urartu TaxID=4572 RepID=A0A8R7QA92_TRIUA
MQQLFKMSDLGLLSYYLGIEVAQTEGSITLSQRSYAEKILELAGMAECNTCHTPMECRLKLKKEDEAKPFDPSLCRSVIGSLRYLTHTRPDITYSVGLVSRFME